MTYRKWYGVEHPAPQQLQDAVYGLTEFARQNLPEARLVANPGCYPTSILLPLRPLMVSKLIEGKIIADSKSGVSGAGRAPKLHTQFVEVADNFSPYSIGRAHRHLPEIEEQLRGWAPESAPQVIFSPHLLPVPRGILSTIYLSLASGVDGETVGSVLMDAFADEPFVDVLPSGKVATLAHVNGTNRCVIGLVFTGDTLILTSAIDNLIKGAAGQAVQNMNAMFGLSETEGLA
jgi:N-acetyl-gamma-glutamyl-phosphate reductase